MTHEEEIQQTKQNRRNYMPLIRAVEEKYQIPQNMLVQLIQQESAFSTKIITGEILSKAGARGIAQFMPATATEWASKLKIDDNDKWKPEAQIRMAGAFLSDSINKFKRNPNPNISNNAAVFAFAEYNAGLKNIGKALKLAASGQDFISALPKETQKYVSSISNWSGENVRTERIEKPITSTRNLFAHFDKLDASITQLSKLPIGPKKAMASFLLDVGRRQRVF